MIYVFIGALAISFAPVCVKFSELGPGSVAFFRVLFGGLFLIPFVLRSGIKIDKSLVWAALAGVIFALDMYLWNRSILLVGAGLATVLANSQVFYTAGHQSIFEGKKLSLWFFLSVFVAFSGVVTLSFPKFGDTGSQWGVALGLLTGLCYCYFIFFLGKSTRENGKATLNLCCASLVCALVLLPLASMEGGFAGLNQKELLLMGVYGIGIHALGWMSIAHGMKVTPNHLVSLIILTQPTLATFWGAWFFDEPLGPVELAGTVLTLSGIYLGKKSI